MAVIKSGASPDILTIDPAAKAARVTLYGVDGSALTSLPVTVSGGALTGAVEVTNDAGNPIGVSASALPLPAGAATEAGLGTDGATPPSISGTGIRGWLRGIFEKLAATLTVQGTVTANQGTAGASAWPVSGPVTDAQLRASAVPVSGPLTDAQIRASALPVSGPLTDAQLRASAVQTMPKANDLAVTAVGAAAAAVTLTLPAVVGQYHYIDAIEITCYASAAGTGGATPVTVTSTNLPGSNAWTFPSGRAIGTIVTQVLTPNRPVRSAATNVATTIVCPATTGVIWRVNVFYTTGA